MRELNIPQDRLSFELVETVFLDRLPPQVKRNIAAIHNLGIDIEVDDLGSGHASLLGLIELEPDRVKLDKQLVIPAPNSDTRSSLVRSLIDIARTLHIQVVAEGVESLEHAALLAELGVGILQGYAFGQPEPAYVIEQLFETSDEA